MFATEGLSLFGFGLGALVFNPNNKGQFGKGKGLSADFKIALSSHYEGELSVGRYELDCKRSDRLFEGKTEITPLILTIRYLIDSRQQFSPYFSGGLGYYLIKHNIGSTAQAEVNVLGIEYNEEIGDTLGYHLGGGFTFFTSQEKRIGFNLDYKYQFLTPSITYMLNYQSLRLRAKDSVDLSGHMIKIALCLFFER